MRACSEGLCTIGFFLVLIVICFVYLGKYGARQPDVSSDSTETALLYTYVPPALKTTIPAVSSGAIPTLAIKDISTAKPLPTQMSMEKGNQHSPPHIESEPAMPDKSFIDSANRHDIATPTPPPLAQALTSPSSQVTLPLDIEIAAIQHPEQEEQRPASDVVHTRPMEMQGNSYHAESSRIGEAVGVMGAVGHDVPVANSKVEGVERVNVDSLRIDHVFKTKASPVNEVSSITNADRTDLSSHLLLRGQIPSSRGVLPPRVASAVERPQPSYAQQPPSYTHQPLAHLRYVQERNRMYGDASQHAQRAFSTQRLSTVQPQQNAIRRTSPVWRTEYSDDVARWDTRSTSPPLNINQPPGQREDRESVHQLQQASDPLTDQKMHFVARRQREYNGDQPERTYQTRGRLMSPAAYDAADPQERSRFYPSHPVYSYAKNNEVIDRKSGMPIDNAHYDVPRDQSTLQQPDMIQPRVQNTIQNRANEQLNQRFREVWRIPYGAVQRLDTQGTSANPKLQNENSLIQHFQNERKFHTQEVTPQIASEIR